MIRHELTRYFPIGKFRRTLVPNSHPFTPVNKIVDSLASITGHAIVRHGAVAANALGLSTQVPIQQIYLTNGRARVLFPQRPRGHHRARSVGSCSRGAGQGRSHPVGGNQNQIAHRRLAAWPALRAIRQADVPDLLAQERAQVSLYVSKSESRFGAPGKTYERLPAPEIEAAVIGQIRTVLTSPESIASVVRFIQRNGAQIDEATTVMAMGRLNDVWEQLFPAERHRIANLMIERIDLVHTGEVQGIKVKWREIGWNALIEEFAPSGIGAELLEVEA